MLRPDGSVRSSNYPSTDQRSQIRDWGIYRGIVRDVIYTDDGRNDSGQGTPGEVLYTVMVVGGDRDGEMFPNARLMYTLGGFANYEEITLKKTESSSGLDISDPAASEDPLIGSTATTNGDTVYLSFVNGSPSLPVIIGRGHHPMAPTEATSAEGPRKTKSYNGIRTEITRDGEYSWTKDNGAYTAISDNPDDPTYPLVNQFAALPGQTGAVTVTLDNQYNFEFAYLTGLSLTISGTDDEYSFGTKVGTTLTISGAKDSFDLATNAGAEVAIDGLKDTVDLSSSAGAAVAISGAEDQVDLSTSGGTSLSISGTQGISAVTGDQVSLTMSQGALTATSAGQASLVLDKTGFIKLGNPSGDALQILQSLLQALTTEAPAGFSAPLLNLATYIQLLTQIQLITGG